MTVKRTKITVNIVQTSLWIFLEGDSVDAETAAGDGEDDDVPVDINKFPETITEKTATTRLIDNDDYCVTQDWMIHFSLSISLFLWYFLLSLDLYWYELVRFF